MQIDRQGLLVGGKYIPSPNCDDRPAGAIELLVIHNISLPPGEFGGDGVTRLFTNTLDVAAHPYYQTIAGLKVSAHFSICAPRGAGYPVCSLLEAGLACGRIQLAGRSRCNDFSIGIEMEGTDTVPFTGAQYTVLHGLTMALREAYPIRGIAGHSNIAPQRKTDPGPCFDWVRFLSGLCKQ